MTQTQAFKVGDRIRITKGIPNTSRTGGLVGQEFTINNSVREDQREVNLDSSSAGEHGMHYWPFDCIELVTAPVTVAVPGRLAVGSRARLIKDVHPYFAGTEFTIVRDDNSRLPYFSRTDGGSEHWFYAEQLEAIAPAQENAMTKNQQILPLVAPYLSLLDAAAAISAYPFPGLRDVPTLSLAQLRGMDACTAGVRQVETAFRDVLGVVLEESTPFTMADGVRAVDEGGTRWLLATHAPWQSKALRIAVLDVVRAVVQAYPPEEVGTADSIIRAAYQGLRNVSGFEGLDHSTRTMADGYYDRSSGYDDSVARLLRRVVCSPGYMLDFSGLARHLAAKVSRPQANVEMALKELVAQALEKRLAASAGVTALVSAPTPDAFKDDDRVRVLRSTYGGSYGRNSLENRAMIGAVGIVGGLRADGSYRVYYADYSDWFVFNASDLELVTEPATLTAPGVVAFEGQQYTKEVVDGKVVLTPYVPAPVRAPQKREVWRNLTVGRIYMVEARGSHIDELCFVGLGSGNHWRADDLFGSSDCADWVFVAESVTAAAAAGLLV